MTSTNTPQSDSVPSTTTVIDSWENRIKQASVFLGKSTETTEAILLRLGVEKEPSGIEMLSDETITPFGDIRKVFCDDENVPIAKLRMAMKYLRGPSGSKTTDSVDPEIIRIKEKYGYKIRLSDVSSEKLIEDYNPEVLSHPITKVLKERYGDKPIIAFKPDSKIVDVEATANYISDIEHGLPEEETIEVDGVLVRLYPIGQIPNQIIDEDPMFVGEPLKRGRSIKNRINWSDISKEARQFIRIAIEMKEIDPEDKREIREVIKDAIDGVKKLAEVYPEVYLEYRERKDNDNLPKLRMTTVDINNDKKQNPFGINRKF